MGELSGKTGVCDRDEGGAGGVSFFSKCKGGGLFELL